MSVIGFASGFLTVRPSILETESSMIVRNGFAQRLCTAFMSLREVEIRPEDETLVVRSRTGLFFTSEEHYQFEDFSHVNYSYKGMATGWNFMGDTTDEVETFRLAAVTHEGEKVAICSFFGEGSGHTGWTGVLLGDSLVDYSGTQEDESREFARYLADLMGLRIGDVFEAEVDMDVCDSCGQRVSLNAVKCLYCGASLG